MKNEVIITAKTVDEAMAQARRDYGSSENELAFEILEMPKKGFLGFGSTPAKVKVTITKALGDVDLSDLVSSIRNMKITTDRGGEEEKKPQKQENKNKNHQSGKPQQQNKQQNQNPNKQQKPQQPQPQKAAVKEEKPAVNENDLPAALRRPENKNQTKQSNKKPQKKERPAQTQRPGEEKKQDLLSAVMGIKAPEAPANAPAVTVTPVHVEKKKQEKKPAQPKQEAPAPQPEKKKERAPREEKPHVEFVTPEEMDFALGFTNTLLKNMELSATAKAEPAPAELTVPEGMVYAKIVIEGDDTGILIGHHGDTLDAIQYLANLCASRNSGNGKKEFVKIVVDIENYRAKREETLRALARRMSAKAVKYKRNFVLEPMNPYERRIIHSEVQGMENVSTHSVGSDENRKIVITYEGPDKVNHSRKSRDKKKNNQPRHQLPKLSREEIEAREKDLAEYRAERETAQKPVRAKSIDDIRIDLSEDSTLTFGSIGKDEAEENLREF
ncbi:MAG: Jag N-terminal domain-containing protein [Clostridia bacterium]|nr:Jag N-terminal domain-containing protein [Clostridia bacterium]